MYDRNDHWRTGPLYDGRASKMLELLEGERDLSCCCCCWKCRALSAACKEKIISTSTKDKKNTEKKTTTTTILEQQYYNINNIATSRICAKEPTNTYYNFEENNVYNKFY